MSEQMPLPQDDNPWADDYLLKDAWCLRELDNRPDEWAEMTNDEVREELKLMALSGQYHEFSMLVVGPAEKPGEPTLPRHPYRIRKALGKLINKKEII